ncbi:aldo/keto reductase [Paenibacillus glycanilyticus]|uniref:aldo/keto reductase n=1 Tax=Paenibacillus glycanilyticus TaxID=126569 RepID=UPI001910208F|nr:aldo/keto reductase [Paenibacillus glycanilyticus]
MTIPQRKLGSTGITVGEIGMGGMPLSVNGRPSEEEGIRAVHAALEQGITLFDTADSYCLDSTEKGHNERLLAKALHNRPEVLIATKGGHIRPDGRWETDGRPEHLRQACEDSLRALGVEAITLYQFHRPDPKVPFAESVGAVSELQREGKIVHVGLSNVSVAQLEEARKIVTVASVQNRMNLFDHSSMDVLKRCEEYGIAFLPYSPLNGMGNAQGIGSNETLSRIAVSHEASPQQIAIAWLLQLSPIILPIPGASKAVNIVNCAGASNLELSAKEEAELNGIAAQITA